MKKLKPYTQWVLVLSIFALTACGGGSANSDDANVETIVAETLQALTQSAPVATEEVLTTNIAFEDIRFYLDGELARTMSYEITAAPDPASDNPFQSPSYYQLSFEGFVTEDPFREHPISWRQPRLYVIPVENMQSFPDGGYGLFQLSQLQQILASKPVAITDRMPVLPYSVNFNNGEAFHSNVQYLDFQNGSGVRFLAEYSQAAFPVGRVTSYIFQGLTSDGKYYVSLALPINQTALDQYNAPYNETIADEASYRAFAENYNSYLLGAIAILESTPDANFTPDLAKLDALVESLIVKP